MTRDDIRRGHHKRGEKNAKTSLTPAGYSGSAEDADRENRRVESVTWSWGEGNHLDDWGGVR